MTSKSFTYLALGDSYTIGEGVAIFESFPYQTIQLLRTAGLAFHSPEIIAKTGWTANQLKQYIKKTVFQNSYDFVTLLIGVNDQFDQKELPEYALHFESLVRQSISFAGNRPGHVFVLSIPDWSSTPFAADKNIPSIAQEINRFNEANRQIADRYQVKYITLSLTDNWLAADQLHPSGKEYAKWAERLAGEIQKLIS